MASRSSIICREKMSAMLTWCTCLQPAMLWEEHESETWGLNFVDLLPLWGGILQLYQFWLIACRFAAPSVQMGGIITNSFVGYQFVSWLQAFQHSVFANTFYFHFSTLCSQTKAWLLAFSLREWLVSCGSIYIPAGKKEREHKMQTL